MEHFEDVNVGETNWVSLLEIKRGLVHQIEKYKWWVILPDEPYTMVTIPCPSLENASEEIRSNRPYPSFGIWLYHFNFEIAMDRKTHFNYFFLLL